MLASVHGPVRRAMDNAPRNVRVCQVSDGGGRTRDDREDTKAVVTRMREVESEWGLFAIRICGEGERTRAGETRSPSYLCSRSCFCACSGLVLSGLDHLSEWVYHNMIMIRVTMIASTAFSSDMSRTMLRNSRVIS